MQDRLQTVRSIDIRSFLAEYNKDREICGVWYKSGNITIHTNYANDNHAFTFSPVVWGEIQTDDNVAGIIHSHLDISPLDLTAEDIYLADIYNKDILSVNKHGNIDYYSPHLPHAYPLTFPTDNDVHPFKHVCYEQYRSDCYKFIQNCYLYIGAKLKPIPRTPQFYVFDENLTLPKLVNDEWELQPKDSIETGNLVILNFDGNSHHFGIVIDNKIYVLFPNSKLRAISVKVTHKYLVSNYKIKNYTTNLNFDELKELLKGLHFN